MCIFSREEVRLLADSFAASMYHHHRAAAPPHEQAIVIHSGGLHSERNHRHDFVKQPLPAWHELDG